MHRGWAVVLLILLTTAPAAATVPIDGGVAIVAPDGPAVTVTGTTNITVDGTTFPDANTVNISINEGQANFTSNGPTDVTVAPTNLTGTYTNVTDLNVAGTQLTINPADKAQASVEGEIDRFAFRDTIQADDGVVDFVYAGTSGDTSVTVTGLQADTRYKAVDQTGTRLATSFSDGTGTVTFGAMPNSEHQVTIQTAPGADTTDLDNPVTPEPITRRTLLLLLLVGLAGSYGVLGTPLQQSPTLRVLGGALLVVLWLTIAFWSTEYVYVDVVNTQITRSNTALSILALVGAAILLLDVVNNAFGLLSEN